MCSSGPKMRSALALLLPTSLLTSLSVTSGESKLRPNELAYLRRITSRTSSTRSSAPTITCVGDEPGLLTQILRFAMASTGFEVSSSRTMRWRDFLLPARESAAKPEYSLAPLQFQCAQALRTSYVVARLHLTQQSILVHPLGRPQHPSASFQADAERLCVYRHSVAMTSNV